MDKNSENVDVSKFMSSESREATVVNFNRGEELPEEKSLRWLANMVPFVENATSEEDKFGNAIHLYATAGADKIRELHNQVKTLSRNIADIARGGTNE